MTLELNLFTSAILFFCSSVPALRSLRYRCDQNSNFSDVFNKIDQNSNFHCFFHA